MNTWLVWTSGGDSVIGMPQATNGFGSPIKVACGCPNIAGFQLRLLGFRSGWLTSHSSVTFVVDIGLPIAETHYIGLKTRILTVGSYIIIAVRLGSKLMGVDVISLLDWKQGLLTMGNSMGAIQKNCGH